MACRTWLNAISHLLTLIVALLHLAFAYVEAVAWETDTIVKYVHGGNSTKASETKVLAQNQGAYNALVALTLLYGTFHGLYAIVKAAGQVRAPAYQLVSHSSVAAHLKNEHVSRHVQGTLLLFVISAAAVGASTVSITIAYVQGAPAALALVTVFARMVKPHNGFSTNARHSDLDYM